jgi:carboxypeptidase PM20D1
MKKFLPVLGFALVVLVGVVLVRTLRYGSVQPSVEPVAEAAIPEGAAERLAGSLRIPTISHEDSAAFDGEAFQSLHRYLEVQFPKAHAQLQRERVGTHSLLYTWRGTDAAMKPILLMGHLDVVPVEPGTRTSGKRNRSVDVSLTG